MVSSLCVPTILSTTTTGLQFLIAQAMSMQGTLLELQEPQREKTSMAYQT